MTKTLRLLNGMTVGEGRRVYYEGRIYYVDAWSVGAKKVWIRETKKRGGSVTEVYPSEIGLKIGHA